MFRTSDEVRLHLLENAREFFISQGIHYEIHLSVSNMLRRGYIDRNPVRYGTWATAASLKDASSRPVQVTRTAIGRALGAITLLRQKLHKMPLTAQVLAGVVETREQYAVRRVWWAAELYCREEVLPRDWQLVMRANVYSLREVSAVEYAVKDAMSMLKSKLSQSHFWERASTG